MKKYKALLIILALGAVMMPGIVGAQAESEESSEPQIPKAVAGEDVEQLVGKKITFDAGNSINPKEGDLTYSWNFGDGQFGEGEKTIHQYNSGGDYTVTLTAINEDGQNTDEINVSIYEDSILMVIDDTPQEDEIFTLKRYASRQRVLLDIVLISGSEPEYIVEVNVVDTLIEKREDIKSASAIITWTSGNKGLSALSRLAQTIDDREDLDIKNKAVIDVEDGSFAPVARFAQSTFDVLQPQYILLTRKSALHTVVDAKYADEILNEIRSAGFDHNLISFFTQRGVKDLGVTNFMSYSINYLINKGVSTDNILLMLMLPIIATIIAFARQFVGIKTFGIYTPTIITLSFLATGLKYGLTIFIVILIVATIARLILRKFKLSYLPRMAIVLTIVAFTILAMFIIGAVFDKIGFLSLSILPILVLIILVEKFISVQIEKGPRTAIMLSLETMLVSIACYLVASWDVLTTFLLAYPEAILLVLAINVLLGKWVGLRISEYIRFREIRRITRKAKK